MNISPNQLEKIKIISAFRKYTRLGLANDRLSPFDAYDRIRGVSKSYEESLDLLAVYDTLRMLKLSGKSDVIAAVYAIYFDAINRKPKKNEISLKIIRYAYEIHCDERTVYRQLKYARKLYKLLRSNM